jgi:RNA polymerase subunit RPABC4/transcription elongation factor Spt4
MPANDFICPNCGAEVPARAQACPECGSDEKTGWSDNTIYDGTDIEDPDEFDYEDWKRGESGQGTRRSAGQWVIWVGTAILVAWLVFLLLR